MKKIFLITLITMFISTANVQALSGGVSIDCPSSVYPGDTIDCTLKGSLDGEISAIEGTIALEGDIEIGNVSSLASQWMGGLNSSKISFYGPNLSGTSNIAKITIKAKDAAVTGSNSKLSISSVKCVDSSFAEVDVTGGTSSISIIAKPTTTPSTTTPSTTTPSTTTPSTTTPSTTTPSTTTPSTTKSTDNYLKSLTVSTGELRFIKTTQSYKITVPSTTTSIKVGAVANNTKSSISGTGTKTLKDTTTVINVVVTSESGSKRTYKLTVVKQSSGSTSTTPNTSTETEKSSNTKISSLMINNSVIVLSSNNGTYKINDNETTLDFIVTLEEPTSTYVIEGNKDLENGSVVTIIVTAEDGTKEEYTINITKEETPTTIVTDNDIILGIDKNLFFIIVAASVIVLGIIGLAIKGARKKKSIPVNNIDTSVDNSSPITIPSQINTNPVVQPETISPVMNQTPSVEPVVPVQPIPTPVVAAPVEQQLPPTNVNTIPQQPVQSVPTPSETPQIIETTQTNNQNNQQ